MTSSAPAAAYTSAASGWARAAAGVYQPLADALVARTPHPLADRLVLDACAGTGCGESALRQVGARVVATDVSEGMLRHRRADRAPCAVSDVCRLCLGSDSVDDVILPFVLNHLPAPAAALGEAARVTRPGGVILASVFSDASKSTARDRIDEVALSEGFEPPDWYVTLRDTYASLVGRVELLHDCAESAGLRRVDVAETTVETGLTNASDLVDYRLSMAQYAAWLGTLEVKQHERLRERAIEAAAPELTSYRPIALFLAGISP